MPLLPGKKNVGKNIEELQKSGRSHKKSVAISIANLRRAAEKHTAKARK